MMQHQGPRNSDEHVDVQDLLRSLPRVGAADGFEQNLMKRVEAENLNVAYQLGNLPKVPAVGDFNDRLHWSIAVHNQISGGGVATQAVETAALAVESTGGRIWLRSGLLLLAMAIGFGSWAAMGDGTVSHSGPSGSQAHIDATPAPAAPAPAPIVRLHTAETGITAAADPDQVVAAPVAAFPMDVTAPQAAAGTKAAMTASPVIRRAVPMMQLVPVSSAVNSATINYGSATTPPAAVVPAEQQARTTAAQRRDTSADIQIQVEIGAGSEASHTQPSIQTGAPDQVGEGAESQSDSIHTGEHRTDDPLAP